MKVSNCCGEKGGGVHAKFYPWSELSFEERDLCPKCGEHCEYIEETEEQIRWKFSDVEPRLGTYISMVWEDGSDIECIYEGLDLAITPLPIYWYIPNKPI